jgi:hypothetical protein
MKNFINKKWLFIFLILFIAFPITASAAVTPINITIYEANLKFTFNGVEYIPPKGQEGFIYNNSTYIPMRFASYALGKSVSWDELTFSVFINEPTLEKIPEILDYHKSTKAMVSTIGKTKPNPVAKRIEAYERTVSYVFFNQLKKPPLNLPGLIINSRLYIPIRFFAESMDENIKWDPVNYTVIAQSKIPTPIEEQLVKLKENLIAKANLLPNEAVGASSSQTGSSNSTEPSATPTSSPSESSAPTSSPSESSIPTATPPKKTLTQQEITDQISVSVTKLKNRCETTALILYGQYTSKTTTEAQKQAALESGIATYQVCEADFNSLMTTMKTLFASNGYSATTAQYWENQYREWYESSVDILSNRFNN